MEFIQIIWKKKKKIKNPDWIPKLKTKKLLKNKK